MLSIKEQEQYDFDKQRWTVSSAFKSRSNIYQVDFNNLSNIKNIYKNISSNAFSTEFANHQESTLSKIEIESTYSKITSNYNYIFDGDPNTSISRNKYIGSRY